MKLILKILNLAVLPATLLAALLLFISGQSPALSPVYSSTVALVGMAFPIWYVLNFVLLVYWAIQFKLRLIIPLFALLFNINGAQLYVQWNSTSSDSAVQPLKIISYNANLFGINRNTSDVDSIVEIISEQNADLVLFQETFNPDGKLKKLMKELGKKLNLPYSECYQLQPNRNYGMCILSEYRIKNWDKIYFSQPTGNMAMYADIGIPDLNNPKSERSIRIYNIHLQSIRFNKSDYKAIEEVNTDQTFDKNTTEGIINRIRIAYEKRAPQVDALKEEISNCKLPKLVIGDFNDVPMSYTYYELAEDLNDAFVTRGSGLETTYKGPFPSFRIDYQLYSDPIQCLKYESIKKVPSDHKMIVGTYEMGYYYLD